MSRLERIPVPCVATFLSFLTLGNVYGGLGFVWLRYLIMALGTIFMICYILKIAMFSKTFLSEYDQTIPASLYGAFSMVLMVLGSFYYEMGLPFGKIIWFIGVAIHCVHIIIFTIKHTFGKVLLPKNFINMMPSWFVTYNGWMVACVTGGKMNAGPILKFITIYGCIIYIVLLPFMIWRLLNVEIKNAAYHTMAVLLRLSHDGGPARALQPLRCQFDQRKRAEQWFSPELHVYLRAGISGLYPLQASGFLLL